MNSEKEIIHDGIIKSIGNGQMCVSIISKSACSGCHAQGNCNLSEMEEKEICTEVSGHSFTVGQPVRIRMQQSDGFRALFLGYLLPFIVLIITMIVVNQLTTDEGLVGLSALGALIPYYSVLFLFRNRLKKSFKYAVEPLN
jgi:sigma-E factor negative regulatory protein RseC